MQRLGSQVQNGCYGYEIELGWSENCSARI